MDPGTVVWLPGTGYGPVDENAACESVYAGTYACGDAPDGMGNTLVYCCY
jgi:hypothetical protein